jgi:dTDP-4-amino-4,6-dideoxygalactose transaminase
MPDVSAKRSEFLSFQPPAITDAEIAAVAETLRSGWLTTGPRTAELEARMRRYLEAEHVLAVSSCTAALHLALVALGVGPGDEVITSSLTWPATANVIVHAGATPVFADVREDTLNIDPARVAELVNERTKAIVPVDLYGQPADLDELAALGLPLVEDAAHAAESRYRGRKVGSISDVTCFSLYATKNIAAGEGGLIATNRDDLAEALDDLRVMRRGHGSLYDIAVPGYKANLSDVLSSIALVQLDKVDEHAAIRRRHVEIYEEGIDDLDGVEAVARDPRDHHANHLFVVRVTFADRDEVQRALAEENIGTSIHFLPVHRLSAYRERLAAHQPPLPVTERAGAEVLSLPLSPAHSDDDARDVVAALRRVHARLAR